MKKNGVWTSAVILVALIGYSHSRENPATNKDVGPGKSKSVEVNVGKARASRADEFPGDSLIVHEWGTFTTFAGANGLQLEYRANVDDDLPRFVYDRARQAGYFARQGIKTLAIGRVRMETPVTYFYTDKIQSIDVSVRFPNGMLTEFYPPVRSLIPQFNRAELKLPTKQFSVIAKGATKKDESAAAKETTSGELHWGKITLIPPAFLRPNIENEQLRDALYKTIRKQLVPQSTVGNHYATARVPDSAYVHIVLPLNLKKPAVPHGDFFEKFLFYRGIGDFQVPLELEALGGDRFTLRNDSTHEFRSLLLVSNDEAGLRFTARSSISPGEEWSIDLPGEAREFGDLAKAVKEELVSAGLYEAEASAMVATWNRSWFHEPGTRLFYVLPQSLTDELLPLTIQPAPQESVRVMVGRYEILTPEDEATFIAVIREGMKAEEPSDEIPAVLNRRGRFAEPALQQLAAATKDKKLREEILRLYRLARNRR